MRGRAYEDVLGALVRLGCEIAYEDDWSIVIVRGAVIRQVLPKAPTVPIAIQRRLIGRLGFSEFEYLDALDRVS